MNDVKRIIIVLLGLVVLSLCAFSIKGHIETEGYKTQVNYVTAIKTSEKDNFNYAVDSRQGRVLTNGQFTADKKLAQFDEMTKGFTYVKRTQEHYTRHTYTTCSKNSCTTHVYYSWDSVGHDEKYASKVTYFDRQYNTNIFGFQNMLQKVDACDVTKKDTNTGWFHEKHGCSKSWDTGYYYLDNNDRYYYEIVPTKFTATFITDTYSGSLKPLNQDNIVLENKSIDQVLVDVGKYHLWAFWALVIVLFVLTCIACYIAYTWVMADGIFSLNR